jgi:diguanylate cyclase (GGDEF)-like protein/PAS domain S-box-containing protein
VRELEKAQFTVSADFVLNLQQCAERLQSQSYDVVVAEYPSPSWRQSCNLQVLEQALQETPLVFVTTRTETESIAELVAHGAFDYVEQEHIGQLPMAIRRALNEKDLRAELEAAGKALRHSQSLYRALADNPTYGICRCDARGRFLDVNRALATMLGYETREEVLFANQTLKVQLDLGSTASPPGRANEKMRIEPVEMEWKRKDGTALKVKVSGRGVHSEQGDFLGYEIIVVDITEQRALEEHLRHQASSDSLTGLANHRRLFEVLHSEIGRSKRTEREFCLILLDLDGLKEINDRSGHLTGDRVLCRLARVLEDCCRSIDTAARQGGDEFALVLPETSASDAALVARRICDLLTKDAEEPMLSVSVGVACCPRDADTVAALLCAADKALYAMKNKQTKTAKHR